MSLKRMQLRTAVVRCLSNGGIEPFPTIAGERVFDSMIGRVQEQAADQMLPLIAVYTDTDQRSNHNPGDAAPIFNRVVDVVIELAIGTFVDRSDGSGNMERVLAPPQTDAETEALLDMLEFQIWRCLFDDENDYALDLQRIVKEWVGWDSIPGRSPEGNHKVSARQLTITCRVTDDWLPSQGKCSPSSSIASLFPPYLQSLVNDIKQHAGFASLKAMLIQLTQPPSSQKPPGISFGVSVDFINPAVDHSLLPEGQTSGPDGRVEIQGDWQPPPENEQ